MASDKESHNSDSETTSEHEIIIDSSTPIDINNNDIFQSFEDEEAQERIDDIKKYENRKREEDEDDTALLVSSSATPFWVGMGFVLLGSVLLATPVGPVVSMPFLLTGGMMVLGGTTSGLASFAENNIEKHDKVVLVRDHSGISALDKTIDEKDEETTSESSTNLHETPEIKPIAFMAFKLIGHFCSIFAGTLAVLKGLLLLPTPAVPASPFLISGGTLAIMSGVSGLKQMGIFGGCSSEFPHLNPNPVV